MVKDDTVITLHTYLHKYYICIIKHTHTHINYKKESNGPSYGEINYDITTNTIIKITIEQFSWADE